MNIPAEIEKCVCFLGCKRGKHLSLKGTAFFSVVPIDDEHVTQYLLTARHVIEDTIKSSRDGVVYARVNLKSGGTQLIPFPENRWRFHQDDRVDVAATLVGIHPDWDHLPIGQNMYVNDDVIQRHAIGPGNRLYFPGLFVRHAGNERNLPIIRTGTIAAMPRERINTRWGSVNAFLVEVRSIGGLSGSPVFVQIGPDRFAVGPDGKREKSLRLGNVTTHFLGLVHGHFDVKDDLDYAKESDDETDAISFPEMKSVNMGIGIVIPAADIIGVFDNPQFVAERAAIALEMNFPGHGRLISQEPGDGAAFGAGIEVAAAVGESVGGTGIEVASPPNEPVNGADKANAAKGS